MISVVGTIGLMVIAIIMGKSKREIGLSLFIKLLLIAVLQVGIVLFAMYTMMPPQL